MLCQNAFLFKFVFSLGYKESIGKISLTIEATDGILVLVLKWCYHAKDLLKRKQKKIYRQQAQGTIQLDGAAN